MNASAAGTTRSTPSATSDATAPHRSERSSFAPDDENSMDADAVQATSAAATDRIMLTYDLLMTPQILHENRSSSQWIMINYMATEKLTIKQPI